MPGLAFCNFQQFLLVPTKLLLPAGSGAGLITKFLKKTAFFYKIKDIMIAKISELLQHSIELYRNTGLPRYFSVFFCTL